MKTLFIISSFVLLVGCNKPKIYQTPPALSQTRAEAMMLPSKTCYLGDSPNIVKADVVGFQKEELHDEIGGYPGIHYTPVVLNITETLKGKLHGETHALVFGGIEPNGNSYLGNFLNDGKPAKNAYFVIQDFKGKLVINTVGAFFPKTPEESTKVEAMLKQAIALPCKK